MTAAIICGMLGAVGAPPAAGQAQWDERPLDDGTVEFQLRNDSGAAIILVCQLQGVAVGFQFGEPIEPTGQLMVRGIPGERENVAVELVGDRILRVESGRGIDFTLRLLQSSANLVVRAAGSDASFEIFGSESVVRQCLQRQEDQIQNPTRRF